MSYLPITSLKRTILALLKDIIKHGLTKKQSKQYY